MTKAVKTLDGWYCLHDLRKINWTAWKYATEEERQTAIKEFKELFAEWDVLEGEKEGSQALYKALGHKADLMFMFLRPTMEELADIETSLDKSKLGEFLIPTYSYISIVELAQHRPPKADVDPEQVPAIQERLKPILPKWEHMCFYPMSRRRQGEENWYTLENDKRAKMLHEHGMTGMQYKDKIKQIVTGSIGLDRWEWAVTLFAHEALQFKKIVYEMRFDEATARYGEFDDFYVGNYLPAEEIAVLFEI